MSDKKITQLTELTSVDNADLLVIVDDVAGTPVTKKVTVANIVAAVPTSPVDSENAILATAVFG